MADEEQPISIKDLEHLFKLKLNPDKMTIDEIVNYLDSCGNGTDKMFIYNAYYFMLKQIPGKALVADTERALGDPKIKEGAKRNIIVNLKSSSEYCDVWLLPQEKFVNYLGNLWQQFFSRVKRRKYEYVGYVDLVSRKEIAGWVINIQNPEERVIIDVYGDYVKRLSLCANSFREDLKLNNTGDGFNGFCISPVPEELLKCSNVQIRTQNDNSVLIDNALGIFKEEYEYVGYIDTISKERIVGWVINVIDTEEKVMVDVYGDGKKKLSLCADSFREDLKLNGTGDGFYGIYISPVPEELLKCSVITIKTKKKGFVLIDSQEGKFRD